MHNILSLFALFITQKNLNRCALEAEVTSYLVLDVSLIREMGQLGIVYKQRERGRLDRYLRSVVDLKMLTLILRCRHHRNRFSQHVVEHTGRESLG